MTRDDRSRPLTLGLVLSACLLSCVCSRTKGGDDEGGAIDTTAREAAAKFVLDEAVATADLAELTNAPHPLGSERQAVITAWLTTRLSEGGGSSFRESFSAEVPNPAALDATGPVAETLTKAGNNVWAVGTVKPDAPCVVALASHYDTKIVDGIDYVGANDSGSSSALLLQLVAYLRSNAGKVESECDIFAVWFDGEEAVLANWNDGERLHPAKLQDNTYGSRHAAGRLTDCEYAGRKALCLPTDLGGRPLAGLVLMDMIGSKDLKISKETRSTASLLAVAVAGADALGYGSVFGASQAIEDDHVPFLQRGVPALDLIDFHNLDTWHGQGDFASTLSLPSLETAGRIALHTALTLARSPAAHADQP